MRNYGELIKTKLHMMKMSQTDLANVLGVTQRTVSRYIRGESEPSDEIRSQIDCLLGIDSYTVEEVDIKGITASIVDLLCNLSDKDRLEVLSSVMHTLSRG